MRRAMVAHNSQFQSYWITENYLKFDLMALLHPSFCSLPCRYEKFTTRVMVTCYILNMYIASVIGYIKRAALFPPLVFYIIRPTQSLSALSAKFSSTTTHNS